MSLLRAVAWAQAAPAPSDPGVGGTVAQDPDVVRDEACRIVSANTRVCAPPTTPKPPSDPSGGFDLSFLGAIFWILLIALLVLMVVMVMRSLGTRSRAARDDEDADDDDLDEVETGTVLVDRSREPVDWRREAEAHRLAGRFRDSMRCRYRALVGDLARRGFIDEIPGRTTGEERAQLRVVEPAAAAPFDAAADLFDGAWYGHVTVDADSDDRFQQLEQRVLSAVGGRR